MRLKDFDIHGKIVYNDIEYNILDIVYEAIVYGNSYYTQTNRKAINAWVNARKQLYTREFLTDVFKVRNTCDRICKYQKQHIYFLKNGSITKVNNQLIKDGLFDNNTILKKEYSESLISKTLYSKYMYGKEVVVPQKKLLKEQSLVYDTLLSENHYNYSYFYKDNRIEYTSDLYRELADLIGYFIPEGENAKEFCYLLLGENETEEHMKLLIDSSENSDSFYGKFRDLGTRR